MADFQHSEAELALANLIVESLDLEDIDGVDIDPEAALFRVGLSLDSIDALEIAMAISQQYNFQLRSDDPNNAAIFSSLRELSAHIEKNKP